MSGGGSEDDRSENGRQSGGNQQDRGGQQEQGGQRDQGGQRGGDGQQDDGQQKQGGQDGQGGQGQQGGQGGQGRQGGQGGQQGRKAPSTPEKVLTGISIVVTLLLFGYVAWQAVQPPGGTQPQVEVVDTERLANGSVLVRVEFVNQGDQGLLSATVEVSCTQPPPDATFSNVPAGGVQQAVLVCPPGTENPDPEVSAWIPT